jgi:chlorobactene glucosyltransferase
MTLSIGSVLAVAVSAALLAILTVALNNARTFPRLRALTPGERANRCEVGDSAWWPVVYVLIPARNEAAVIGDTVTHLLAQSYPNLRIAVLDDHSEDATAHKAQVAAAQAANFQLLCGCPLPSGWQGKNWACHQLARYAIAQEADILLFTDADVHWEPDAVAALVAVFQQSKADLLTVWPTQTTVTWGERLTVPLMALAVLGYLPLQLAHDFYHPLAAAANGQCLAFGRSAYEQIGGHAAVAGTVVEDIRLAQGIKAAGLRLRMADGNLLVGCRMYDGWQAALDGYAKNILAGHGNHVLLLLLSTLFHWALFVWPWLWLALGNQAGAASSLPPGWPVWPLLLVLAGVGVRAITAAATHQRTGDALLMPISVLLMTRIALRAIWWRWRFGGVLWKGRILRDA